MPRLPHTWRPLGVRVAGGFFAGLLLLVSTAAWLGFDPEVRARFTLAERITAVLLGLALLVVLHALGRSRLTAEERRLVVVNGYRRRELEWAEVLAVHLPRGAPWATLDLADGTTVSVMGIQSSDGTRATRAVRAVRALLATPR